MKRPVAHRLTVTLLALAALVVVLALAPLRDSVAYVLARAHPILEAHPVAGALLFVALAIASATMAFVSSIVLVPIAVSEWGPEAAAAMLWAGWFVGGNITYAIGRRFGRPIVHRLVSAEKLQHYEDRLTERTGFASTVALMLAMPSDIAGYLFGILSFPRRRFVPALAIAEAPYSLAAAYLGAAAVQRQPWTLVILIAAAIIVVSILLRSGNPALRETPT